MGTAVNRFTDREIRRAIRAATTAGAKIKRFEIHPTTGALVLHFDGVKLPQTIKTRGGAKTYRAASKKPTEAAAQPAAA